MPTAYAAMAAVMADAVYLPECFLDQNPAIVFFLATLCWAVGVASGALCMCRVPLDLIGNLGDLVVICCPF